MIIRTVLNCTDFNFCFVSDDSVMFTTKAARCLQVIAISILILTSLVGNGLLWYSVLKCSNRTNAAAVLLINLAVVDILVGVLVLPMWILSTMTMEWPLSKEVCEFTAFMTVVLMSCSVLSLCAIAVDRYCSIAFPLRYPVEITAPRLSILVVCLWAYCILVASCPLLGWGDYRFQPQTLPICNPVWVSEITFAVFLVLSVMALPLALMLFSYLKIVLIAKDHIRRIDVAQRPIEAPSYSMNTSPLTNAEVKDPLPIYQSRFSKSLKMVQKVFIAVAAFFLCWSPYVVLNFWSVNHEETPVPFVADLLVTLLAFANSSINPILFIVLNKEYRQTIRGLGRSLRTQCTNRVMPLDVNASSIHTSINSRQARRDEIFTVNAHSECVLERPITSGYATDNDSLKRSGQSKRVETVAISSGKAAQSKKLQSAAVSTQSIPSTSNEEHKQFNAISRSKSFRNLPDINDMAIV